MEPSRRLCVAKQTITRRAALHRVSAAAALAFPARVLAQSPPPEAITPALIGAARQEGKVHLYTAMEIAVAERYARIFEAKFPGWLAPYVAEEAAHHYAAGHID